jgi:hypothetical protein
VTIRRLELARVANGVETGSLELVVHSGKDPLAILLEAAEDLCLQAEPGGVERIDASDVAPFVLPRLAELLDPDNHELRFVLSVEGGEKVSEHTILHWVKKGEWPGNGSVTLEAAVLAVKLAEVCREAARNGEGVVIRANG